LEDKILRVAFDPIYAHPLPEGHRFPMIKYEIIPEQLIYEGTITANNLFKPGICADDILLQTHTSAYLEKLNLQTLFESEQRKIGFPQSPELTLREKIITQGTIDCALYGIENGVSLNIAGGTHHAFTDRGEGFCLLNDFAIAANYLLHKNLSKKIIIIDLDVHQGNGTAKIFEHEDRVYTFSMHGAHNYPFHKEKSDLDIPLPVGTTDEAYLSTLSHYLNKILDEINPDFAFYLSGVDILETDKFGKLKVTMQGCKKRDEYVFQSLRNRNIPCAVSMGGGYSPDYMTIVEAHCQTFRLAKEVYEL
jgi:acetoin utilization deacetylase AcuC-like enzyme